MGISPQGQAFHQLHKATARVWQNAAQSRLVEMVGGYFWGQRARNHITQQKWIEYERHAHIPEDKESDVINSRERDKIVSTLQTRWKTYFLFGKMVPNVMEAAVFFHWYTTGEFLWPVSATAEIFRGVATYQENVEEKKEAYARARYCLDTRNQFNLQPYKASQVPDKWEPKALPPTTIEPPRKDFDLPMKYDPNNEPKDFGFGFRPE